MTPTNTPTSTSTPTPTPSPTPAAPPGPPPPTADLGGKLAIPLAEGNQLNVYVFRTDGTFLGRLDRARQPDYSQDSAKLVVNGDFGPLDKLRVSDDVGGGAFEIGDPGLGGHSHPAWSPDGNHVIYDDDTVDGRGWRILHRDVNAMNGPGSGEGIILRASVGQFEIFGRNPLWASGDRFVFQGCNTWENRVGDCGIWVMEGNNGQPRRLTQKPNQVTSDVDGDVVVYASNEAGNWNVYTLNIDTGENRQITLDSANDGLPTISPDGRSIAFISERGGVLAVWRANINGGGLEKLFDIPAHLGNFGSELWAQEKMSWGR